MPDFTLPLTQDEAATVQWHTQRVNIVRANQGLPPLTPQGALELEVQRMILRFNIEREIERKDRRWRAYVQSPPETQTQVDTLLNTPE